MGQAEELIAKWTGAPRVEPLAELDRAHKLPGHGFLRQALASDGVVYEERFVGIIDEVSQLAGLGPIQALAVNEDRVRSALVEIEGIPALIFNRGRGGLMSCECYGPDLAALRERAKRVRDAFAEEIPPRKRDSSVAVAFWSGSGGGYLSEPRARWRRFQLPTFAEIAANYPEPVRDSLERVVDLQPGPDLGGRLLLWHGEPGTGKTWALRALGWEWRNWCTLNYITDPERFLGGDPDYLYELLLETHVSPFERSRADDEDEDEADEGEDEEDWNLIVLEDASEFLGIDAHSRIGQAFSRLLNLLDGLLGQGSRNLVLITTNEPLGKLHPAILRPGRIFEEIEFHRFTAAETERWLAAHGLDREADRGLSLAEAYAELGRQRGATRSTNAGIGFS